MFENLLEISTYQKIWGKIGELETNVGHNMWPKMYTNDNKLYQGNLKENI